MTADLRRKIMESAINRMREADEKLAVTLSDLRLIYDGKKENGEEVKRLLDDVESVKTNLADILTLAINRDVFALAKDEADE